MQIKATNAITAANTDMENVHHQQFVKLHALRLGKPADIVVAQIILMRYANKKKNQSVPQK
jgi:hypothetical protein